MSTKILVASVIALMAVAGGCDKKDDAAKAVSNAVDKTTAAAKDAGTAVGDAASKAGAATKDAASAATTWLNDTVTKQWPEAKKMLDEAGAKVASLTGESKTKGENLVKELKAQVPAIEESVTKLKNATGAEASAMLESVKTTFNGWMAKLSELKTLVGTK